MNKKNPFVPGTEETYGYVPTSDTDRLPNPTDTDNPFPNNGYVPTSVGDNPTNRPPPPPEE